jgi:nucleoside-triphosphatase THEP1
MKLPEQARSAVLSLRWQRAAMLGSLWAANEIVLGSFLHNTGIPFAGTVLASIAVALLVAGFTVWQDAGIIWRAGVVCSLMKSISPSAVILGPMVGILLEAIIVAAAIAGLRGTITGCILGGMLATVTPMLQKIIAILFTYGMDMARMYASLFTLFAEWFGFDGPNPERALLWFIALQAVPGMIAAIAGIAIGRGVHAARTDDLILAGDTGAEPDFMHGTTQPYSISVLGTHVFALVAGLLILPMIPRLLSPLPVALYLAAVVYHYPSLRPKFKRVRLWLEFGVVTLFAGVLLGILAPGGNGSWWTGLTSGVVMTARATLVVAAFSAISLELRNPVILEWFFRRGLGTLSVAMRMAFRALPAFVQSLSQQRHGLRHPIRTMSRMLALIINQVDAEPRSTRRATVFIISGEQGSGKTTTLDGIVRALRANDVTVRGFLSHVIRNNGDRTGYDLEILGTGDRIPLCRRDGITGDETAGPFTFTPGGVVAGMAALGAGADGSEDVTIVDEVGPLEMKGKGWAPALPGLFGRAGAVVVLAVRPGLVAAVQEQWQFIAHAVWKIDDGISGRIPEMSDTVQRTLSFPRISSSR